MVLIQGPTVRGEKVESAWVQFIYHPGGSRFPELGPQNQRYLETLDKVDAEEGWALGRPGLVGTNFLSPSLSFWSSSGA